MKEPYLSYRFCFVCVIAHLNPQRAAFHFPEFDIGLTHVGLCGWLSDFAQVLWIGKRGFQLCSVIICILLFYLIWILSDVWSNYSFNVRGRICYFYLSRLHVKLILQSTARSAEKYNLVPTRGKCLGLKIITNIFFSGPRIFPGFPNLKVQKFGMRNKKIDAGHNVHFDELDTWNKSHP